MLSGPEPSARIRLLRPFEVSHGDRLLLADDWPRNKAAALLKRLAWERRLVKDPAIEFLWPEASLVSAAHNLYRSLYSLRKTLNAALGEGAAGDIVRFEDGVLSLAPAVWVDVREFERLLAPSAAAADLEGALKLYRGDFLPDDRCEEWTLLPRQALYHSQRTTRLALAGLRRQVSDYEAAIALLLPLPAYDAADEEAHRELMRLFAMAGRRHEALRQFRRCEEGLAAELDVGPSLETKALYAKFVSGQLEGDAALAHPFPPAPLHPPPLHRHNFS